MDKIKTGLAAFGMSGQVFHAPFISTDPHFELTAILERSKNMSREHYPQATIVRSMDELLSMDDLELVVINTPNYTHYEYVRKALEAGKNVIVEKPFTDTVEEGEDLIELADKKGLMLCVYHNRRWDADFLTIKELIDNETLGRIVEFESTFARFRNYIRPHSWKEESGGITFDLGSHLLDQCVCLFGMPGAIFADIATLRTDGKVDDYFVIHPLRCEKAPDIHITLKASYLMCAPEPRFIVHGTKGSYVKYGVDKQEALLKQGAMPDAPDWGIETEQEWGIVTTESEGRAVSQRYPSERGSYAGFYDAVYRHMRKGEPLETDARNILPIIHLLEIAKESSEDQRVKEVKPL